MNKLEPYRIDLLATKGEPVERQFVANEDFFKQLDGEIERGEVRVTLRVAPVAEAYRVSITFEGHVEVPCDRCLEPMSIPVKGEAQINVRLGATSEDDGEVIQVAENDGVLDLSWQVYEQIALQIPIRHVHPDGECPESIDRLLSAMQKGEQQGQEPTNDPRWDALRKLVQTNN